MLFGLLELETNTESNNVFQAASCDVLNAFFSNMMPQDIFENSKHFGLSKLSQAQLKPLPFKIVFESEERARHAFLTFLTVKADTKFS